MVAGVSAPRPSLDSPAIGQSQRGFLSKQVVRVFWHGHGVPFRPTLTITKCQLERQVRPAGTGLLQR
jgi:hypothetical protein